MMKMRDKNIDGGGKASDQRLRTRDRGKVGLQKEDENFILL